MFEALVLGRDAQRRGVVICAVVHAGDALPACVDHARDQRCAVGAENRLRGFHLDFEAQRAWFERARLLQRLEREDERVDLLDRRHLRQRDDEAVGEAARLRQRAHEQLQRAHAAAARRCLETLDPDPVKRRGAARSYRGCEVVRGSDRRGVLVLVGPNAVAVLDTRRLARWEYSTRDAVDEEITLVKCLFENLPLEGRFVAIDHRVHARGRRPRAAHRDCSQAQCRLSANGYVGSGILPGASLGAAGLKSLPVREQTFSPQPGDLLGIPALRQQPDELLFFSAVQ